MKNIKYNADNIKNIVIARTDKIGDIVLSIPTFNMVKKLFPASKITVIANSYNYRIISLLPIIDDIILIDKTDEVDIINRLKTTPTDIFIALYTDNVVGRIAKKSAAKIRIAPISKLHSYFRYNFGLRQHRSLSIKNEAEYNLELVRTVNKELFDKLYDIELKIKYSDDNKRYVEDILAEKNILKPFIIINPFSGGSAKNLTVDEYYKLAIQLRKLLPNIEIVISSSEKEYENLGCFLNDSHFKIYVNNDDLLNLTAFIDMSDLFIGGSTGATHIAGNLRKLSATFYPANQNQGFNRWGTFGNEKNTLYIVPDNGNEDMVKNKIFNNLTIDDIIKYAEKIVEFYDEKRS